MTTEANPSRLETLARHMGWTTHPHRHGPEGMIEWHGPGNPHQVRDNPPDPWAHADPYWAFELFIWGEEVNVSADYTVVVVQYDPRRSDRCEKSIPRNNHPKSIRRATIDAYGKLAGLW